MPDYLDKVRKLLERTTDRGHTVAEAATAAAAAQSIIDKHRVDLALLRGSKDPDEEPVRKCVDFPLFTGSSRRPVTLWKWDLAWALGEANGCAPWSSHEPDGKGGYHRVAYVVGKPSDAQTVQYLHQYLCAEIDRFTKQHRGKGRDWLENFRRGAVEEIADRLEEKRRSDRRALKRSTRKEAKGNPGALVKVNTALSRIEDQSAQVEKWMEQHDLTHRMDIDVDDTRESPAAYEEGRATGAVVSLGDTAACALGDGTP